MITTLIKNGLVYDGSGLEPVRKDILIRNERIARLGDFSRKKADVVIDATGALVLPGFIDINSSVDHYLDILSADGGAENLKKGITTAIGGNCGSSLAPSSGVGSLKSVRKWGDVSKVNVGWHTVQEFLKILEKRKIALNFGTLVGHSTIRRSIIGEDFRDLTDREMATFKKMIVESFKNGAFGFSTGLEFAHSKKVGQNEILELVRVVAAHKRIYATHLRDLNNETGFKNSIEEIFDLAKITGANVEISHLLPLNGLGNEYLEAKSLIERETADTHINFDCYSIPRVAYPVYQLLPKPVKEGNLETMLKQINSEYLEASILKHFKNINPDSLTLYNLQGSLKFLSGKTLKQLSESFDMKSEQALLKVMRLSHLRAVVLLGIVDEQSLEEFLASPSSIIASGGLNFSPVFTDFLKWAKDNSKISLQAAVMKTTSIPAIKLGIKKRGLLKEDYYADLVLLRDFKPTEVIVNGALVLENNAIKNHSKGRVLRYAD